MTLTNSGFMLGSEALAPIVSRTSLIEAASHAGSAAAMHAVMHASHNPKEAIWKSEADVWAKRRDRIVKQEPFRSAAAAAALAGSCYSEAYQGTYIDLT